MFFGWRVVGGAFAGMVLANGFFSYAFTVLVDPIRAEFGASLEQVMYSLTIGTLFGLVASPVTGILIDRHSVRALMTFGSLLVAAGFYLMAQATSITEFNLATGLTMTIAMAFTGSMAGSAAVSRWFTRSLGKAMGIAAMGSSLGGIVIPALLTYWLKTEGWRSALQNMSLTTLFLFTPLFWLCIRSRPADVGLLPQFEVTAVTRARAVKTTTLGMSQIVRMREFWFLGFSMGLVFSAFAATLANLAPYATRLGVSEANVSSMIALLAFGGLVGKLAFGIAADRVKLKAGMWMAHALMGTAFLLLILEPAFFLLLIAVFLIGLSTGGLLPVWSAMLVKVFGVDSFGRAMGAMGPIITLNLIPAYIAVGRLFDSTGSYTTGLIVFTFFIGLAAMMLLPLRVPE